MVAVSKANEADEANKVIATDSTNATNKADLANEAANANVANRANEASLADEADDDDAVESDVANEADSADEAADAAETTEADEADVANYAIVADDFDGAVFYSLTKYSAIFAEVKGCFGIIAPNNQLGRRSSSPSEVRIGINLTTNWKLSLRRDWFNFPNIEVTINLVNVSLKLVGKLDTTIHLESLLNKEFGADCAPSDLSGAAMSPKMMRHCILPQSVGSR